MVNTDREQPAAGSESGTRHRRTILVVVSVVVLAIVGALVAMALVNGSGTEDALPPAASTTHPTSSPSASPSPTSSSPTPHTTPGAQPAPIRVPIDQAAEISPSLTARISKIEAVKGVAEGPGEVAAPSVRVTVEIENATDAAAPLDTTVVTAYYSKAMTPAAELREPGGKPFGTSVAAGGTAKGVYVFSVPVKDRDDVTIMVDYSLEVAPLQFHGAVPR